ncbi:MAG: recombinase family protein [Alphaproteobacteria bacterium]
MPSGRKRCAVYTRKSTEEGLQQDFNSLDAQAESCSAYILSQAGEGWSHIGKVYSDGGISGGHMERPGLLAMIADIESGLIDIVVVYKVDRLTRSLADFAKLVDVFDKHRVSFVSITQAFNTTTSMGRLTLNVLLSFAQFEREVTAERIRDKIAASKKRGQWMGGLPPLGYDNIDKKLVVSAGEARTVKHIMKRYVDMKSVSKLKTELDRDGYLTKSRMTKKKSQTGGRPFSRGHLYKLLCNPVYIGKITHKGEVFDGQHEPIVDQELWEQVQAGLKHNAPKRRRSINIASNSLLTGMIYGEEGERLTPIHSKKPNGRRYRYYISARLSKGEMDDGTALRLPAKQIEGHVINRLTDLLGHTSQMMQMAGSQQIKPHQASKLDVHANELSQRITSDNIDTQRTVLIDLISQITISPKDLTLDLRRDVLLPECLKSSKPKSGGDNIASLSYPLQMKRRGVETKLIIGGVALGHPDPELIKLIAKARGWYDGLKRGRYESIKDIGVAHKLDNGDVSRTLSLAFLAPSIIHDIIAGKHPVDLTPRDISRKASRLPLDWAQQRKFLGMKA